MTNDTAIKVENLSKCYHIYDQPRLRLLQMLFRGHKQFYREFWALKDVSFEVKKGETVGIIGRNGSAPSTLLHLVCGTIYPGVAVISLIAFIPGFQLVSGLGNMRPHPVLAACLGMLGS